MMSRMSAMCFGLLLSMTLHLHVNARTFEKCELAKELLKQGFPRNQLQNWVCLIEAESGRQTHLINRCNRNGSRDYGLFAINDMLWCSRTSRPGKGCRAKCADMHTDDITEAAKCAKIIHKRLGFDAWYSWQVKCKDQLLPDLLECYVP